MKDCYRPDVHIAIVGMAIKAPRASSVDQFWTNLKNGRDCFSRPSRNELERLGVRPRALKDPSYVPSKPLLEDIEYFDADFFDIPDSQAELMDPAHRLFLECVWEAMEQAGEVPGAKDQRTGLFAGADTSESSYLFQNLRSFRGNPALAFTKRLGTSPDYFTLRVAHALDLTGPVLTTLATCSTSLMAVHLAAQHLRQRKCSLAIAGGARIELPAMPFYRSTISGMNSTSGYLRPFDADADGTIFGSGVAVVLLKRLVDAIEDGNPVHGVILGSGFCNDGNPPDKLSFTAPAPSGQARAIAEAIDEAGINPRSIGYVECHGTGTLLGDPTEVASLSEVFGAHSPDAGYCAIGSVKGNVGHLGSAAGVTSLIKACLAVRHGVIPGTLHFSEPNPEMDLEHSPFYVTPDRVDWSSDGSPRRAGVSAFGFGGANAHLLIEQYVESPREEISTTDEHLLVVSAKSTEALARRLYDLAGYLEDNPGARLADVAHTLKHGRKAMPVRAHAVAGEADRNSLPGRLLRLRPRTARVESRRPVVFLLPGQGSQKVGMGQGLYDDEPAYKETVDYCAQRLEPELGFDLREKIHRTDDSSSDDRAEAELTQTAIAQPALFVVEYALAKLYERWGMKPAAMLGHSLGELVAACLAGVFSLEDGLRMVAVRSRLMQKCDPGSMLAVLMPLEELLDIVPDSLDLAGINSPNSNVVAGPTEAILDFAAELDERDIGNRILNTSHAFHSRMLDPTLEEFSRELARFEYHPPSATVISNVTGVPMTESQALNPDYWVEQRRRPVRFSAGLAWCLAKENPVFIEVGPGKALSGLARQHDPAPDTVTSLCDPVDDQWDDSRALALDGLGKVWSMGGSIDWPLPLEGERKIMLPTYPFERKYLWRDSGKPEAGASRSLPLRLYEPGWSEQPSSPGSGPECSVRWLVFADGPGFAQGLISKLEGAGYQVTVLEAGDRFLEISKDRYEIVPGNREHLARVVECIRPAHGGRLRVLHFWALTGTERPDSDIEAFEQSRDKGFHTLVGFLQAAHAHGFVGRVDVQIYADGLSQVQADGDSILPENGNLLGPVLVGPREIPGLTMRCIDVPRAGEDLSEEIFKEAIADHEDPIVALRDHGRYVERLYECEPLTQGRARLRPNATVLITGGVGGLGLKIAAFLFDAFNSRLVLTSTWELPPRGEWEYAATTSQKIARAINAISALEARGAEVRVIKADVCDTGDMRHVLSEARRSFGRIHGVVHAAGTLDDCPVLQKSRDSAEKVMAVKAKSALILDQLLRDQALDVCIYFSSRASTSPAPGQGDYSAANAVLDRLARRRHRLCTGLSCAIGWGAWRDVGMAWNLEESRYSTRSLFDSESYSCFKARPHPMDHPLIESYGINETGDIVLNGSLKLHEHWVTREHYIRGKSVLSATTILEMLRAAFGVVRPGAAIEMSNIVIPKPMVVEDVCEFEIFGLRDGDLYQFELRSRNTESDDTWTTNCSLFIRAADDRPIVDEETIGHLEATGKQSLEPARLAGFGPRWHCHWTGREVGDDLYVRIALKKEFTPEVAEYGLHPALFDRALHNITERLSTVVIPYSFETIRIYGDLPKEVLVKGRRARGHEEKVYEMMIVDPEGNVLVEVKGYLLRPFSPARSGRWEGFIGDGASRQIGKMELERPGDLTSFRASRRVAPDLEEDEVRIQVKAAGLNFRDVLSVLGRMPENDPSAHRIGTECSGIVVEVGSRISHVEPGDRVVALADDCFATSAVAKGHFVTSLPASLSYTQGASIPTTFLTVDYALNRLAALENGERILIHAAAGGIGLAAVQIAQQIGAEIFATAGNSEKRAYLASLGIEHVMSSRSLDFVDEVTAATAGQGVDVVLNSLAGEYIPAGMSLLRPFGRFVELGKKDIYLDSKLGLYPFRNNLSYFGVDLGQFRHARQGEFLEMFEELIRKFALGELRPGPTRVFSMDEISRGFEYMARGRHIGKIVFTVDSNFDAEDRRAERFRARFGEGIGINEGLEVFRYLLSSEHTPPSVVVVPNRIAEISGGNRYHIETETSRRKSETFVEPRNPIEERVRRIWEKTLGISPVSVDDEFSDLGGDSINAIMIQVAVQEEFGTDLSLVALSRQATVAKLAELIGRQTVESTGREA